MSLKLWNQTLSTSWPRQVGKISVAGLKLDLSEGWGCTRWNNLVIFVWSISQQAGILNPWIWSANNELLAGPTIFHPDQLPGPEFAGNLKVIFFFFTAPRRNIGFYLLKCKFSLTNRCKEKEKHQQWNKRPGYSSERRVFTRFCWQHFAGLPFNLND